jgi:hypothetical protein
LIFKGYPPPSKQHINSGLRKTEEKPKAADGERIRGVQVVLITFFKERLKA